MSVFNDWFENLPPEDQQRLDDIARSSILELPRCPRDYAILEELLAWQQLEIDVLDAYADWLTKTKARFAALGIDWTTEELNRRSDLWEHE